MTSIVYQETPPDRRAELVTASEEGKYFTAYPSLAVPADSSRDSATLKDLPTTQRIAERVTQPPEKPVLLQQTREISEIPDGADLILSSADQNSETSPRPADISPQPQENYNNISQFSHKAHATPTGNYS